MSQGSIAKRRSTPTTRAGQYMCPTCGKIFDTKKEVDNHIHKAHQRKIKSIHNNINGAYTE